MQAFEIKANKSDYPYLVIASGFKSAVEVLHQQGIYDTDIVSVQQLEPYKSDHILHKWITEGKFPLHRFAEGSEDIITE